MAVHHHATITPTKAELLEAWVPRQPWYTGPAEPGLELAGAYRFDDPDGEVGVETHLVRTPGGPWLQVPLTYRGAPLSGAEEHLVCTMEHTTLGRRWIYDGRHDPVHTATLAATILGGGRHADLFRMEDDGTLTPQPVRADVRGSGGATDVPTRRTIRSVTLDGTVSVIEAEGVTLHLPHVLGDPVPVPAGAETLQGTWAGQDEPLVLSVATARG